MNDLQTGYDNPVQAEEKSDTESYSNQIYQLNSSWYKRIFPRVLLLPELIQIMHDPLEWKR